MDHVNTLSDSEVLRKAAAHLETYGLAKYTRKDGPMRMCALGVLDFIKNGSADLVKIDEDPLLIKIVEVLGLPTSTITSPASLIPWTIADWANAQNKEVVIAGFRKVADFLEA